MSRSFNLLVAALCSLPAHFALYAQISPHARVLMTQAIDENQRITLRGNTRPEATRADDRGRVADSLPMEHMFLQLQRSPEQQQALESFLGELQDPDSPNFHKWITAEEFGARFGLAPDDINMVTDWLHSHGFTVNVIYPNLVIDFSGTAGQVRQAFRTEIHRLAAHGQTHLANMSDPQIPAALATAVAGVTALHNFMPHPLGHAVPAFATSSGKQAVVPADLATIYNLKAAFAAGYSGKGQTIAVLEDSDVYSEGDWLVFRKVFGLARPYSQGSLITVHPQPGAGGNCADPGANGNDAEAILDAELASAAAPNATIQVASCADTNTNFGGFIALQNLLTNGGTPPAIVSLGFGMTEADMGAAYNSYVSNLYQMAVAQGVSIFVSAGDTGASFSNSDTVAASGAIAVSGFASTPYNVAVGGTDFADTYFGTINTYWSSTNSPTFGSAQSYIPEIAWNNSCASRLIASSKNFPVTYGADGYCNSGVTVNNQASGGGPSGCASGSASTPGLVSGSCAGYPKPSWQSVFGNPSDGVRDVPDVALFGSNGAAWGHYYVICYSDTAQGGKSCLGEPGTWNGFGGTSTSAPVMAGIQALVNQKTGSRWGNPDSIYYTLAAGEYGTSGSAACNSEAGSAGGDCTFYDITLGDTDIPCRSLTNCYYGPNPGIFGVLSTDNASYQPAYEAAIGWDFATGIGSINAWNLLANWPSTPPAMSAGASPE